MPHATNTLLDCDIPYITHGGGERYITGVADGTTIGYKYFAFNGPQKLTLRVRGTAQGRFLIKTDDAIVAAVDVEPSDAWHDAGAAFTLDGVKPLYFYYEGTGRADLLSFRFA